MIKKGRAHINQLGFLRTACRGRKALVVSENCLFMRAGRSHCRPRPARFTQGGGDRSGNAANPKAASTRADLDSSSNTPDATKAIALA
ncbi:hypothetical protein C4553_03395 [Candidatus Parcubacteria bacterium]|nr:MAG: hypothetical protein C4553_03395 [Candidatus Parcubacteria bacterium]